MKIYGWAAHHCKMGDIELEYTARAKADYVFDKGSYWDPPFEDYGDLEFEIDEVRAYLDDNEIEVTEEMREACEADTDNLDEGDVDWDEPEPDYPELPDPDDWNWGND